MTDYTKFEKEVDAQADMIWDRASHVWEFAQLDMLTKVGKVKGSGR